MTKQNKRSGPSFKNAHQPLSAPGWRAIAAIATGLIENGKLKGGQIETLCSQAYASRTPPRNWVSEADLILNRKMIRAGYLPS
jgi:hypothetical protein